METWKPVVGFESSHEVSDLGAVRRIGANASLSAYMRGGYPAVTLSNGQQRKIKAVHLIVLEAFVGPRPRKMHGAHLNGNRLDAAAVNLRWVRQSENEAHKRLHGTAPSGEKCIHARLSNEQAEIVREAAQAGISQTKLAVLTGLSENSISEIVRRKRYA